MNLNEFISRMGVVLDGTERFIWQENALWYDCYYNDFVSTGEILRRIYEQCDKELSM